MRGFDKQNVRSLCPPTTYISYHFGALGHGDLRKCCLLYKRGHTASYITALKMVPFAFGHSTLLSNCGWSIRRSAASQFLQQSTSLRIRQFSASSRLAMLTTELSEAQVSALRANKERLAKDLHHSCQWGSGIRWGE